MTDIILQTRVEELRRTLWRAGLPQFETDLPQAAQMSMAHDKWRENRPKLELERLGRISAGVWRYLDRTFGAAAHDLDIKLSALQEVLDHSTTLETGDGAPDAQDPGAGDLDGNDRPLDNWSTYQEYYDGCQALFVEFVELAGGLAFLDRCGDPWIFKVADELLHNAVIHMREDWSPLTVPLVQDTVVRTMAQILRLPFPDWTVWALPLTIAEFAHVYLAERDLSTPQGVIRTIERVLPAEKRPLSGRDRQLLADVFATTHLGPSYAIAALRLRLGRQDSDRAHVILSSLSQLGRESEDRPGPYQRKVVEPLRSEWDAAAMPQRTLSDDDGRALDHLVGSCLTAYKRYFPMLAYRTEQHHGAQATLLAWKQATDSSIYEDQPGLAQANTPPVHDLRQVLDAVWLARLEGIADDHTIAGAGEALCLSFLKTKEPVGGSAVGPQVGRQTADFPPGSQPPSQPGR
jgi:hypothetical protein